MKTNVTFTIDKDLLKRFKIEQIKLDLHNQSALLETLISEWIILVRMKDDK